MTTVPSMREDKWRLTPSPVETAELEADLARLDNAVDSWSRAVVGAMAAHATHTCSVDREHWREIIAETLNDALHREREWITNRLQEIGS